MEKRKCRYCKKEKPIDDFEVSNVINGKPYRRWKCKECYLSHKNDRKKEKRKELQEYKKKKQCEICGHADYRVLEFHHPKNNKEFSVADGISRGVSMKRLMQEIAKCKLLCANCHRAAHYKEL